MKRVTIIVMDSAGIGALPDAAKYGDLGTNTIGNIAAAVEGFELPNLVGLGLGNIAGMKLQTESAGTRPAAVTGCYGKMAEKSAGKDTTTGHWELAGIILEKPFPVFPDGFPRELIKKFEELIKTQTLGNYAASGTEIIKQLGQQHVKTGYPIVYTSADSVFQIAAHEAVIPVERLYEICKTARSVLTGDFAVGRVIARPFAGEAGSFVRTDRRRDFSLKPTGITMLDLAVEKGLEVKAVGKIEDIFAGAGITDAVHTHDNMDGVNRTLEYMRQVFSGIIFTNLVDFDMLYGHRNNPGGYAGALMEFDKRIPELIDTLKEEDILVITADHGCDPTTPGTDHTREYVPLVIFGPRIKKGVNLGIRSSFSDLAATVSEYLEIKAPEHGTSFLDSIL